VNFKEILQLIDKVADRGIATLEIEQAGVKIRIAYRSPPARETNVVSEKPISLARTCIVTLSRSAGGSGTTQS
jgi:hypothetical protein